MSPMHPRSSGPHHRRRLARLLLAGLLLWPLAGAVMAQDSVGAADAGPLPNPMRVGDALERVDALHPRVRAARAEREQARAELEATRAERDVSVNARLEARWIEPNDQIEDRSRNDSRAAIVARKLLSDFGQSHARESASEQRLVAARQHEELAHARHRIHVLERYFDVLLADLAFARDTEAMAAAYVSKERAEERNQRGQVSDIEVFRLESEYQTLRVQRTRALQNQARTRAALAEALNRPDRRVRTVLAPMLPLDLPELPDLDTLLAELDNTSPRLLAERRQVEAASREVAASRAQRRPRLYAEAESGWWNRDLGGGDRNPFAAGLVLEIPLYEGRRHDSRIGQAVAARHRAEAELGQARIEARNRLRELHDEIRALRTQRDEAAWRMDYRELYIDRARYLYDIEDQADLGDSMVQQSAAAHFNASTEYQLALAYERLALLSGRDELSPFRATQETP
ncbi:MULTISPECIES: TolC family protein [unclassified Thioalkalivibrio]|uniref:TolC family protein n=1 Tax=unclassified Thioalkalivibrio TaxID=2621013 RepID=UPI00036E756B|nr:MULTISPECIES: TolC family protein [unclassified Thioalkalivibrio]